MLLLKISIFSCLLLFSRAEDVELAQDKNEPLPIIMDDNTFETAHKIHGTDLEFHTSHKISNLPKTRYLKLSADDMKTAGSLMHLQQTQSLLSTKERPELNPILSALINEDVMKSIEAKRAIEHQQLDAVSAEAAAAAGTTEGTPLTLTTGKPPVNDASLEDEMNSGLIDQSINFDGAGSENNQKSRIQIKKGPNGMDYEYEYVYYYYDDDEAGKKQQEAESRLVEESSKKDTERGKSRYTNIDRSTTSAPDNVLISGKAKGRANSSAARDEDVEEGRLPVITRFPSRGKNIEFQPTASLEGLENTASASNEKSKKISVKRPSLELVDSETFNTDEKQVKGSPRNGDSEKITVATSEVPKSKESEEEGIPMENKDNEEGVVSSPADEIDQTTPLMEKAALDLYAILANENLEMSMTTDADEEVTTTVPDTTESDEDALTTFEAEAAISTTSSTTTTTTTTESSTTTTTTPTTTTTTTTTAAPSLFGAGRRGLASTGRNRFRLKNGAAAVITTTTEEPAAAAPSDSENTAGQKGRVRFHRPSFASRNRAVTPTSETPVGAEEGIIVKEEEKPVAASPPLRGRTRNRFNLRGQVTTTTTPQPSQDQQENDDDNLVSSTTARSFRSRPTLNLRGRSRIGARPTPSTQAPSVEEDESANVPVEKSESDAEEKVSTSSLPTRPSRFNLNRAGGGGVNRLLPRARLNTLRTTSAVPPSVEAADDSSNVVKEESDYDSAAKADIDVSTSATSATGINRLKTRPRLQVQAKTENKQKVSPIASRKVNPLLARRKLAIGPSTTEAAIAAEEPAEAASSSEDSEKKDSEGSPTEETATEDSTELPETTTKQARGLGLLAQRRRLPIRKPGTAL